MENLREFKAKTHTQRSPHSMRRLANYATLGNELTGNMATRDLVALDEFGRQVILQSLSRRKPVTRTLFRAEAMDR